MGFLNRDAQCVALGLLLASGGCVKKGSQAPTQAPQHADKVQATTMALDQESLEKGVRFFASDEMGGRHTLSGDIDRAAQWLATQYREAGIAPATGTDYMHRYALPVAVREQAPAKLELKAPRGKAKQAKGDLAPCAHGGSGQAQGAVVFVGYGLSEAPLDELAGVDLKGKIALLFDGAPGQVDLEGIGQRAREIAKSTSEKLAASKPDKRPALIAKARAELAKMFPPKLQAQAAQGPKTPPETPAPTKISNRDLLAPVWSALRKLDHEQSLLGHRVELSSKLKAIKAAGAVGAIVVRPRSYFSDEQSYKDNRQPPLSRPGQMLVPEPIGLPTVFLGDRAAQRWLSKGRVSLTKLEQEIVKSSSPKSQPLSGFEAALDVQLDLTRKEAPNVLAMIPGGDLAEEIVVVGAHFDHIGKAPDSPQCGATDEDKICNGADDNASGTIALLEIARALAASPVPPRRTVVFAHFSGEELGLWGSRALVRDAPLDWNRAVAMINVDMIGRLRDRDLLVGGLATSPQWVELLDGIDHRGVNMVYDASSTSRSDHAAFVERKIPAVFFFSGIHDQYHRPGDETQQLDLPSYQRIASMVGDLVTTLAQGAPIQWSEPPKGLGLVPDLPGDDPDHVIKRVAATGSPEPATR